MISKRELNCNSVPWIELKEARFSMQGNSEAILSRTSGSFSLDIKPDRALDARTRIRRLLWVEHFLMNGMNRNGSRESLVSLVIVEGLSRDRRISMGHRLGCTAVARLDPRCSEDPSLSNSVATCSSSSKKGCNEGYLQKRNIQSSITRFWPKKQIKYHSMKTLVKGKGLLFILPPILNAKLGLPLSYNHNTLPLHVRESRSIT